MLAVFTACLALAAGVFFAGGWVLRGAYDRYRAVRGRDARPGAGRTLA